MDFDELMAAYMVEGAELPDDHLTLLGDAHAAMNANASAAIAQLETEKAALAAEVQTLQAHNYKLMMTIPQTGGESASEDDTEPDNLPEDGDLIDELFEETN